MSQVTMYPNFIQNSDTIPVSHVIVYILIGAVLYKAKKIFLYVYRVTHTVLYTAFCKAKHVCTLCTQDSHVLENKEIVENKTLSIHSRENVFIGTDKKVYTVRVAKYGPVLQSDKIYIGLNPYLKYVNKSYLDLDEQDVKFITSLPKTVSIIDGSNVTVRFGRYGFYLKHNEKT